jgi:hypothetical protein
MHITTQKEQFSKAFLYALCARAGFEFRVVGVDFDSVDAEVVGTRAVGTTARAPHLSVQLKCTHTDTGKGPDVAFALPIKNYDDLRDPLLHTPRILVVLTVPKNLTTWLHESAKQTSMRRCAYWMSLRGLPAVVGQDSKTVHVPRSQMMTSVALDTIMNRIGAGGLP